MTHFLFLHHLGEPYYTLVICICKYEKILIMCKCSIVMSDEFAVRNDEGETRCRHTLIGKQQEYRQV